MKVLFLKIESPLRVFAPPLGMMYLSSVLKKNMPSVETRLLNLYFSSAPDRDFARAITEWQPDVICATIMSTDAPGLKKYSAIAKELKKDVLFFCGGALPSNNFEDFPGIDGIDAVVKGEGEEAILKLAAAAAGGTPPVSDAAAGISVRERDGTLAEPGIAPMIKDLDALPFPDWTLIDFDAYSKKPNLNNFLKGRRSMAIFASRGCPFSCTYCHNTFGSKVRFRSPGNVVDEMEELKLRHGVDEILVYDDTFNVNRKWVMEICDGMIERKLGLHLSFANNTRGDMFDEEMLLRLKQAGMYCLNISIDTASPRMQKLIKKNLDVDRAVETLRLARKHGLITKSFFMIGFPGETLEEIRGTVRLALTAPLTVATFNVVTPFKGTEMFRMIVENHGPDFARQFENLNIFSRINYYQTTTGVDIRRIQRGAILRFYLHPIRFIRLMAQIPRKFFYLKQLQANILYLIGIKNA